MTRTVLIVIHDFPPARTTGTERTLRFAHYLPQFGYVPLVLTTNRYGSLADDRVRQIFRAQDWMHDTADFVRRIAKRPTISALNQQESSAANNRGLLRHMQDLIMIPDTRIGWAVPGIHIGKRLLQENQPALVFSSSPPETVHLVAQHLSVNSDLPWVADLRDGWTFEPPKSSLRKAKLRRSLENRLERRMVYTASRVVSATAPIAADLAVRYPACAPKIDTITNGYDEREFTGLRRQRACDGRFLITYTGSLSASREGTYISALFAGVALHLQYNPDSPVRLRMVGNIRRHEIEEASRYGLEDVIEFFPPVSRREAHQHQLDADALLLVTAPGQRSVATLKLFEYIRAGNPIFALAQNNAAASIVAQDGLGILAPPDQPTAIADGIDALLHRYGQDTCARPCFAAVQAKYDCRRLTEKLARLFDELLN